MIIIIITTISFIIIKHHVLKHHILALPTTDAPRRTPSSVGRLWDLLCVIIIIINSISITISCVRVVLLYCYVLCYSSCCFRVGRL